MSLQIDKENEHVAYNDEVHKYWVRSSGQQCISVTTLIGRYTVFDRDFWLAYKALELTATPEQFAKVKPILLDKKIFNESHLEGIDLELFEKNKKDISDEWDAKRDESCFRGTQIHKELELGHLAGDTPQIKTLGLGGKFGVNVTNKIIPGEKNVYPELLISRISNDGELRVAGQADLVIIDGFDIHIQDYKTNKEIKTSSYFDRKTKRKQMMAYPLNNIEDVNFYHYSLQMSTYAWMLEKQYPELNVKSLTIVHHDHDGNVTDYECPYLKTDVERMLAHYKREIKHESFKKSREKIKF